MIEGETPAGGARRLTETLRIQAAILASFVGVIWGLEIVDVLFLGQALNGFGVRPRTLEGLWGILFMPFLHGGLAHVAANTVPFVILGWLVMLRRFGDFLTVTAIVSLITGAGLWLLGAGRAVYIGSSGLIFGYLGFLLLRGFFDRGAHTILVSIFVVLVYGGLLWGVLPQQPGISWEAHLLGFMSGALAARLLSPGR